MVETTRRLYHSYRTQSINIQSRENFLCSSQHYQSRPKYQVFSWFSYLQHKMHGNPKESRSDHKMAKV